MGGRKYPFLGVWIILTGMAAMGPAAAHSCAFEYGPEVQNGIVLPILKEKFGNEYVYYDFETPFIEKKGALVELTFDPTKSINGKRITSERDFVIQLDCRSLKVTRTYEEQ